MIDLDSLQAASSISAKLARLLRESSLVNTELVPVGNHSLLDKDQRPLPRWPSGFMSDFDALFGGFCGLTVLAGPGGSGKSTHAISCALENALQPSVCIGYFDAENSLGDQIERATRWWGGPGPFASNMANMALRFNWIEVLPGMSWQQLMSALAKRMLMEHEFVLLVFDSVFSMARCFGGKVLEDVSKIYLTLTALVRRSKGRIRVLALSELNKGGEVKGLEGVYASTLALKLEMEPERGEDVVRLKMLKNRSGKFRSDLGLYEIDADSSRLRRWHDAGSDRGIRDPYALEH